MRLPDRVRRRRSQSARPLAYLIATTILLTLSACDRGRARTPESTPVHRAQALIDAGNQAYRTGDFGLAARRYAAAAVIREDDPAAYYGLGMALARLGRDEEARKAYARARELAQREAAAQTEPPTDGDD
jgi:Flp pilus assembly protein TadD